MKRNLPFFLLACIAFFSVSAINAQTWQWGKRAQNRTKAVTTDNYGNSYVLWSLGLQANVDGHAIPVNGNTDIGVTSFACDGTYRWTKVIGTSSTDAGFGLETDTMGGVYILGFIGSSGTASIVIDDDDTLPPTMKKILLLKYDTAGNFLWQRMPESDTLSILTNSNGFNLSVEPNGNIHLMAALAPGIYANGAYTATQAEADNLHVLKYDKNGTFTGGIHLDVTRSVGAGISPYGFTMIHDPVTSRYYWAGQRYDPYQIAFGGVPITGSNFMTCFSSSGSVLWVQTSNNDSIPTWFIGEPATDPAGNIYATGMSYNNFNGGTGDGFGSYDLNNTIGPWAFPFLVKFDPSGNVLFANNASGNTDNNGTAVAYINGIIAVSAQYAGGTFAWDGISLGVNNQYYNDFIAQFDAVTGAIISIDTLYSSPMADEYGTVLTTDPNGNFYLGGEFNIDITIAGTTMNKQDGFTDGYLAKLGAAQCFCAVPVAGYTSLAAGLSYTFTYNGSAAPDSVLWNFGDGSTASGTGVSHTFGSAGNFNVCVTAYNSCGSDQFCTTVAASGGNVGVAGALLEQVVIYPNPADEILTVAGLPAKVTYRLCNAMGTAVSTGYAGAGTAAIDVAFLPAGLYVLQLFADNGTSVRRPVIVR